MNVKSERLERHRFSLLASDSAGAGTWSRERSVDGCCKSSKVMQNIKINKRTIS